jgi:hypothetical protein
MGIKMKPFRMLCFSNKCSGYKNNYKGVAKSENKKLDACPDCGDFLFQDFGTPKRVKDIKKSFKSNLVLANI